MCWQQCTLWVCSSTGKEIQTNPNKSMALFPCCIFLEGSCVFLCCLKTFRELGEPQYHQYQRIIIEHSKNPSKSTVLGGVCRSFVPLRSEFWDINLSYWRAGRAAESWALWKTFFGCQWRIIWLLLSWKSNPIVSGNSKFNLGTLNSWSYLLSRLIFSVGNCDLYLGHWLLYLSQLSSYLCCAYFKSKLYRQIKICGFMKREMGVVGGKITIF